MCGDKSDFIARADRIVTASDIDLRRAEIQCCVLSQFMYQLMVEQDAECPTRLAVFRILLKQTWQRQALAVLMTVLEMIFYLHEPLTTIVR